MHATAAFPVVGVDLSKHVFELAVADDQWRIVERARLSCSQFERWFAMLRGACATTPTTPAFACNAGCSRLIRWQRRRETAMNR